MKKNKGKFGDGEFTYIELTFNLRVYTEILPILSVDIIESGNTRANHPTQTVMDCDTPTVINIKA